MSARLSNMTRELERSRKQVANLQRQREKAFMAVKERDERVSFLEQELGALRVQLRHSATTQRRLSAEIARLRQQLKYHESDFD